MNCPHCKTGFLYRNFEIQFGKCVELDELKCLSCARIWRKGEDF
jgi:hypothetical protein